jgi:hypothetical protein
MGPADKLLRAVMLRDEWLGVGLSAQPADRPAAEAAVTALYALAGAPKPSFEWAPSPAAAVQIVRPDRQRFPLIRLRAADFDLPNSPVATRLASLQFSLRHRLDSRDRRNLNTSWLSAGVAAAQMYAPEDALLAGIGLDDVLEAAVYRSLRGTLRDALCGPLRTALAEDAGDEANIGGGATGFAWYGQQDAYWVAQYDVRQRTGASVYQPSDQTELDLWSALARSTGWWWPGESLCVMAERPLAVHTEPQAASSHGELRLHCDDGPAVAFADRHAMHVLHGTRVPEWVLTRPSVDLIRREPNVEVRRSAIERIGWESYIRQAALALVAECPDPGNPGASLCLYHDATSDRGYGERVLLVVNGTPEPDGLRRRYGINVPAIFDNPVDAAAWTYGLTGRQYCQLARRT